MLKRFSGFESNFLSFSVIAAGLSLAAATTTAFATVPTGSVDLLPITKKIPIQGGPDWIGIGFGSTWVKTGSTVLRINSTIADATLNTVVATIPAATCRGFAEGFGRMWSLECGTQKIIGIDPMTNTVVDSIPVVTGGGGEGSIAAGENGIWVVSGTDSSKLTRIDPATHAIVTDQIQMTANSNGVVAAFGYVWVSNSSAGTVSQIDPATNTVTHVIAVGMGPRFIAAGEGAVWTINQGDGSVSRIAQPVAGMPVGADAPIVLGVYAGGGDIKVGEGGVWVTVGGTPLIRIDPTTLKISHIFTGSTGDALNVGFGSVWLPAYGAQGSEIWRIDAAATTQVVFPTPGPPAAPAGVPVAPVGVPPLVVAPMTPVAPTTPVTNP